MRFVLAMIVFLSHLHWGMKSFGFPFSQISLLDGRAAVYGFFLISGVSISHSYIERPAGYFRRRFLRVYPLYFVAVAFTMALVIFLGPSVEIADGVVASAGWKTTVANFLLLQGFAAITITYNLPLWSLSCEVFYYLLTPLFYRASNSFLYALTALSAGLFLTPNSYLYGFCALKFAWPWLLGFLLVRNQGDLKVALLCALGCALIYIKQNEPCESLRVVTYAMVVLAVLTASQIRLNHMAKIVFDYLGELSYPLYLFHAPLMILFYVRVGIRDAFLFVFLVLLATAGFDWFFDKKLKTWFWKPAVNLFVANATRVSAFLSNPPG